MSDEHTTATSPEDPIISRGIPKHVADRAGLELIPADEAVALGFSLKVQSDCILVPYSDIDGRTVIDRNAEKPYARVRVLHPDPDGPKYLSRAQAGTMPYIPPGLKDVLARDPEILIVTEGEIKALIATAVHRLPVVGIQGVACWHDSLDVNKIRNDAVNSLQVIDIDGWKRPPHPAFETLLKRPCGGLRTLVVVGDADLLWNPNSGGKRQLEDFVNAARFRLKVRARLVFCPPVQELEWVHDNGARIVEGLRARDKKSAAKLADAVEKAVAKIDIGNVNEGLEDLYKIFGVGLPEEKEALKAHKTGLDDLFTVYAKEGRNPRTEVAEWLLKEARHATSAVSLPYIPGELNRLLSDVAELICDGTSDLDRIYGTETGPGRIEFEKGKPVVKVLSSPADLENVISTRVRLVKRSSKRGDEPIDLPRNFLHTVAMNPYKPGTRQKIFPDLFGIRTMPTVAQDGTLVAWSFGYHDGIFWDIPHLDEIKRYLKERPSIDDVRAAVDHFYGPFRESLWDDASSLSGVLAIGLTMLHRQRLPIAPGFLISAPGMQTGKSYTVGMLARIVYGAPERGPGFRAQRSPIGTLAWRMTRQKSVDEEELNKAIFSALSEYYQILFWDNLPNGADLATSEIDKLITNESIDGRLMRTHTLQSVSTAATVIFTGNNVNVSGDTVSRLVLLRQKKTAQEPVFSRERDEWEEDIRENLAKYQADLLTIARWSLQRRDELASLRKSFDYFRRFPEWNLLVRAPIVLAGMHGVEAAPGTPLTDPCEAMQIHNVDLQQARESAIFSALYKVFGTNTFLVTDITKLVEARKAGRGISVEAATLLEALGIDEHSRSAQTRIGGALVRMRGQIAGGLRLVYAGTDSHSKAMIYRMESVNGGPTVDKPTPVRVPSKQDNGDGGVVQARPNGHTEAMPAAIQQEVVGSFLTKLDDECLEAIEGSKVISLDIETTGLDPHDVPLELSGAAMIGDTAWRDYAKQYGDAWDGSLRVRVLSLTLAAGRTMAWDMDMLDAESKIRLITAAVEGKTLVGHNLTFDLRWLRHIVPDIKPARILDTMLLTRALAPDLPVQVHIQAANGDEKAMARINGVKNGMLGVKLIDVAKALGMSMPEGKAWQKPEAWAVKTLSPAHYRYATGDTRVALEVLRRLAERVGIPAGVSAEGLYDALDEAGPPGWVAYKEAFEPAVMSLLQIHETGLPFDTERAAAHIERLEGEVEKAVADLLEILPDLAQHREQLRSGGLTDSIKEVLGAYFTANGLTVEIGKNKKPLIGDKKLPNGARDLPYYGKWSALQDVIKRKQMLESIAGLVREDGRLHPRIEMLAVTGRTTSEAPNVQNMPRDAWFRELVRAGDGKVLVGADFSAIEMRVAAVLAQRAVAEYGPGGMYRTALLDRCEKPDQYTQDDIAAALDAEQKLRSMGWKLPLSEVFRTGVDPHVATGLMLMRAAGLGPANMPDDVIAWLAGMEPEEQKVMKKAVGAWRQRAKAANFGLLYGQQAAGLHRMGVTGYGLTWTQEEADRTRQVWLDSYPDVVFWQVTTRLLKFCWPGEHMRRGYSGELEVTRKPLYNPSTLMGRPLAAFSRTEALNYQDQGSGAEIALMALNMLPEELRKRVVNFVHDEILVEVDEQEAGTVKTILEETMIQAGDHILGPWGVPTEATAVSGKTWPKD